MVPSEPEDIILHKKINAFGKKLSVVRLEGEDYLIGVQIATLLRRETFNMYRSMKIKNIHIKRANPDHVDYLCKCNAVRPGTHSVTLIPYESGLYFVADAWFRQHRGEGFPYSKNCKHSKSFILAQPKLHRRKAHPWNVCRSIKKGDLESSRQPKFVDLNDFSEKTIESTRKEDIIESLLFAADSLDISSAAMSDSLPRNCTNSSSGFSLSLDRTAKVLGCF